MARGDPSRTIGGALAVGAVVVALAVLVPRMGCIRENPELILLTALKQVEHQPPPQPVPGCSEPLVAQQDRYDRISIGLGPGDDTARAVATLDFQGKLGETLVSSVGFELVSWQRKNGDWVLTAGPFPTLAGIVGALEARRRALERGDASALEHLVGEGRSALTSPELRSLLAVQKRTYQVTAWYIRSEREAVLVSEEYRLRGQLPDRPVDQTGTRRLKLVPHGREFFFSSGLM